MNHTDKMQEKYPSVELAYPLAIDAYKTALGRLDALDNRVHTIMAFSATVTLAIPVLTAGEGLQFTSGWFISSMIFFLIANTLGIVARIKGTIHLISPQVIFESYLDLSEWEFKKDTIYWSGKNYVHNNKVLMSRNLLLIFMVVIFFLEVVALAVWATAGP